MGGHGGLNILPQKKWNVYNYENREKVRQDEESAARDDQLKRDQSRRRDAEFRIERLRQSRTPQSSPKSDSHHINLFENVDKKRKREDVAAKAPAEDEKYKLGYGLVGKGVKAPWYVSKTSFLSADDAADDVDEGGDGRDGVGRKNGGRKTVEELREERMRREKKEKERERLLLASMRRV